VADFHAETTPWHGAARRTSAAEDRSHATAPDDTSPPHLPFHWRDAIATEQRHRRWA